MSDITVFPLVCGHVGKPFCEELFHIVIQAGGADKCLGIAGPAEPFVALGTVCGHIQEIALLAPDDIVKKPVELLAGAA